MLKATKISEATPLTKVEVGSGNSILIPVSDGTTNPKNISVQLLKEVVEDSPVLVKSQYLSDNYYTKTEVDVLVREIIPGDISELEKQMEILTGDEGTEGSIKYQIEMAKTDLIGPENDPSSNNTINSAKTLVAESLKFINYNN